MFREVLRILFMQVLNIATGVVIGAAAAGAGQVTGRGLGGSMFALLFFGALVGHHAGILIIPLLWRRPIAVSYAIVVVPSVAATVGLGLLAAPLAGFFTGGFVLCVMPFIARMTQPIVFPEHLPGLCPKCAYDLRGCRSIRCPECGAKLIGS